MRPVLWANGKTQVRLDAALACHSTAISRKIVKWRARRDLNSCPPGFVVSPRASSRASCREARVTGHRAWQSPLGKQRHNAHVPGPDRLRKIKSGTGFPPNQWCATNDDALLQPFVVRMTSWGALALPGAIGDPMDMNGMDR
jgi:hypothetical protein